MRITSFIFVTPIIFIMISLMFLGQELYNEDFEDGIKRDIYNYTESKLVWNNSLKPIQEYNNSIGKDEIRFFRVNNFVSRTTNFFGATFFDISKFSIEYGYNNPHINLKYIIENGVKWIKILIWIMILGILLKAILPIFAIIYISVVGFKTAIQKSRIAIKKQK